MFDLKSFITTFKSNHDNCLHYFTNLAKNFQNIVDKMSMNTSYALIDISKSENINTNAEIIINKILNDIALKSNIDLSKYYGLITSSQIENNIYDNDLQMTWGNEHIFQDEIGNTIERLPEFTINIFLTDEVNILTIGTNLSEDSKNIQEPVINELTFHRNIPFTSIILVHAGDYTLSDKTKTVTDEFRSIEQWSLSIEFISKNDIHSLSYPKFKDVISVYNENINDIDISGFELIDTDILKRPVVSYSNDRILKQVLNKYHYNFESFYKSLWIGNYNISTPDIDFTRYDLNFSNEEHEIYNNVNEINVRNKYSLEGLYIVPKKTNEVINILYNLMKKNNLYTLTLSN